VLKSKLQKDFVCIDNVEINIALVLLFQLILWRTLMTELQIAESVSHITMHLDK